MFRRRLSLGLFTRRNGLIRTGCSENVNGSPSETGQCTYNIGLLIRDPLPRRVSKLPVSTLRERTEVVDQAERFTQVQPYVLTFAKDPATFGVDHCDCRGKWYSSERVPRDASM